MLISKFHTHFLPQYRNNKSSQKFMKYIARPTLRDLRRLIHGWTRSRDKDTQFPPTLTKRQYSVGQWSKSQAGNIFENPWNISTWTEISMWTRSFTWARISKDTENGGEQILIHHCSYFLEGRTSNSNNPVISWELRTEYPTPPVLRPVDFAPNTLGPLTISMSPRPGRHRER